MAVLIEAAVSGGHTAAPVASRIFAQMFGKRRRRSNAASENGAYAD